MSKKFTLQEVIQVFAAQGCEYLDDFYNGVHFPHSFLCSCGNVSKIRLYDFKGGHRCAKCGGSEKLNLDGVKLLFENNGCVFLDHFYVNSKYKHNYKCSCGNKSQIRVNDFKRGDRCSKCGGNQKPSLEEIQLLFSQSNCEFLDKEYKNANFKHNYKCSCGNLSKIQVSSFKNGHRCAKCAGVRKCSLQEIQKVFSDAGCEFLDSNYNGAHFLHTYRCSCGNISAIKVNNFKNGSRCMECSGNKKFTLEEVQVNFQNANCCFLDDTYEGSNHKHNFKCECGNISKISLHAIKHGQRCEMCSEGCFNKKRPGILYLLKREGNHKVGICNLNTDRLRRHQKNNWVLIEQKYYEIGQDAYNIEQKILKLLDKKGVPRGQAAFIEPFDGYTESWNAADLFVKSIEDLLNKISM